MMSSNVQGLKPLMIVVLVMLIASMSLIVIAFFAFPVAYSCSCYPESCNCTFSTYLQFLIDFFYLYPHLLPPEEVTYFLISAALTLVPVPVGVAGICYMAAGWRDLGHSIDMKHTRNMLLLNYILVIIPLLTITAGPTNARNIYLFKIFEELLINYLVFTILPGSIEIILFSTNIICLHAIIAKLNRVVI